jgi:ribosome-associated protein
MTRRLPTASRLGLSIAAGKPPTPADRAPAPEARELAIAMAERAIAKSATDVLVLDLEQITTVTSYFLICTGSNPRLLHAVVDELVATAKTRFGLSPRIEGRDGNDWVLLDYGSLVVHAFSAESRAFYQLERLWADAPIVTLPGVALGASLVEEARELAD